MASTSMSGKRIRFSRLPPHLSVRWLTSAERNCIGSQPWAPWIMQMSNPASFSFFAHITYWSMVCMIFSSVMAFMTWRRLTDSEGP
jgi:lipoprotein signal peptidase